MSNAPQQKNPQDQGMSSPDQTTGKVGNNMIKDEPIARKSNGGMADEASAPEQASSVGSAKSQA